MPRNPGKIAIAVITRQYKYIQQLEKEKEANRIKLNRAYRKICKQLKNFPSSELELYSEKLNKIDNHITTNIPL